MMRKPTSVATLSEFGRIRLSWSFSIRDFLFSDIAAIHGLANIPDDPDLAIAAGFFDFAASSPHRQRAIC